MAKRDVLSLDHIDPRWSEGRDYQLVCGFSEGPLAENNEIIVDHGYNSRKVNRFVPYRICEHPAPVTFGDVGEFLIGGEWVVCEFGGPEWWGESNKIGCSVTRGGESTYRKGVGIASPGIPRKGGLSGGRNGGLKIRNEKKGIFALSVEERRRNSCSGGVSTSTTLYIDPNHPELGTQNAGNLVRMQRKRGYPSERSNRVKVS
jgi:hypothetical protein